MLIALAGCAGSPSAQQASATQTLAVTCAVDNVLVPLAQPVAVALGKTGETATNIDSAIVHPAVVAACATIHGTPAVAVPASTVEEVPAAAVAKPAG